MIVPREMEKWREFTVKLLWTRVLVSEYCISKESRNVVG